MSSHLYTGPLTDEFWTLLKLVWKRPLALQSNTARQYSQELALAASQGWVSVIDPDGKSFRPSWRITQGGITALQYKEHFASC